jgi:hypothetical protein
MEPGQRFKRDSAPHQKRNHEPSEQRDVVCEPEHHHLDEMHRPEANPIDRKRNAGRKIPIGFPDLPVFVAPATETAFLERTLKLVQDTLEPVWFAMDGHFHYESPLKLLTGRSSHLSIIA